jgi:hypothetical protein
MVEDLVKKLSNINLSSNKPTSIVLSPDAARTALTKEGGVERSPYRLDFQGFTTDKLYANFQLQVGTKRTANEGTAAEVLMQCNSEFAVTQIIKALQLSLEKGQICLVHMIHKRSG